jgi:protein-disulfide isomerase
MTRKTALVILNLIIASHSIQAADSIKVNTLLTVPQQNELDSITSSFQITSCRSMSFAQALKRSPPCPMATHLYPFAQWLAAKGKTYAECMKDLADRQRCAIDTQRYSIDLSSSLLAGDVAAPVTIVVYISGLCPLCKYISSELYNEVTIGALKGKARLAIKPCKANRADEAIVAAAHFKKQWEYLIALHNLKVRPDEPILLKLADSLGMSSTAFGQYMDSRALQLIIEHDSEEAVRNGVTIAPTLFINGKRYHSYKDPQWVVDAALWEYATRTTPHR